MLLSGCGRTEESQGDEEKITERPEFIESGGEEE
jgi:hypothetical protein